MRQLQRMEIQGSLRGCVGTVSPREPLHLTVASMAKAAAFEDTRFPPVASDEFDSVTIEISRLTPMRSVRPDEVVPGRHGLLVTRGGIRGLLLPQVATDQGWDRRTFLEHTCMKAGLPPDSWTRDDVTVLNPRVEFRQRFAVVVLADAGVEAVVPAVKAADQVVPLDRSVGHQGAAVQAAAVEHGNLVVVADHDEIDSGHQCVGGFSVFQIVDFANGNFVHFRNDLRSNGCRVCGGGCAEPARGGAIVADDVIAFTQPPRAAAGRRHLGDNTSRLSRRPVWGRN